METRPAEFMAVGQISNAIKRIKSKKNKKKKAHQLHLTDVTHIMRDSNRDLNLLWLIIKVHQILQMYTIS